MTCEICGKSPATVHYTAWENNQPREMHVCQPCALDKGIVVLSADKEKFSIQDPVIALFNDTTAPEPKIGRVECGRCGLHWSTFRETGRLGCSECYESFEAQLKPLLRRIHGNLTHTGKAPHTAPDRVDRRAQLQALQAELESAIARENFERAAEIRDRIRLLRQEPDPVVPAEGGGEAVS